MPRVSRRAPGLGQSLINDRFGMKLKGRCQYVHAAELPDDPHKVEVLQSVTEQTSLDDFLATAEMAGTEFAAEKQNIHFVESDQKGLPSQDENRRLEAQNEFQHLISIPRRPPWNEKMSKETLESKETELFLSWRRQLAEIQENNDVLFTPYEKNLDFWRQLWRVIERSDVVAQIVDARNPLMFRCRDLEAYVKHVDPLKKNLLLVNKADLLSANQRQAWTEYFKRDGVDVVFFSAMAENDKLELEKNNSDNVDQEDETQPMFEYSSDSDDVESESDCDVTIETVCEEVDQVPSASDSFENPEDKYLLTREELIDYFKSLVDKESKVVGMVGYPNVGKSSTVNTLLGLKKVPVSATPGRTKHFQTLFVDQELCLCDCPGLVFPSFALSKADMILNGILPIDQMRDHVGPVNLLSHRIPRAVIEGTYGINIKLPREGEDPERPPTSIEILDPHALSRGFMTSRGQPDNSRSARLVLKDYVNGSLLYGFPPPNFDEELYQTWTTSTVEIVLNSLASNLQVSSDLKSVADRINRVNKRQEAPVNEVDKEFFRPHEVGVFIKGKSKPIFGKGRRPRNKKKEKVRRIRKVVY